MGDTQARTIDAVTGIVERSTTADGLLEELANELHRAIPHDGAAWFGIDPVTMLAAAPSRTENLEPGYCSLYWHLEFHEQDFAAFSDLARGDGASALRLS